MVEDGLFEKFPCDSIYALHNWPLIDRGTIAVHKGPVMASEDDFDVIINGKGECMDNPLHIPGSLHNFRFEGGHAAMVGRAISP